MERDYLFRGKTLETHEWIYGGIATMNDRYFIIKSITYHDGTCSWGAFEVDPETVGQWTGLWDKHEVKIFEDDIVHEIGDEEDMQIVWDNIDAQFIIQWQGVCTDFSNMHGWELEVVDNVHDNKERDTNGRL